MNCRITPIFCNLFHPITLMKIAKLFLLSLAVVLFSCGNEDPKPDGLIGSWFLTTLDYEGFTTSTAMGNTNFKGFGKDMDMTMTFSENPNKFTSEGSYTIELTINAPGQTITEDLTYDTALSDGTWAVIGNTLTVTSAGVAQDVTIISQTSTTLELGIDSEESQDVEGLGSVSTSVQITYTLVRK